MTTYTGRQAVKAGIYLNTQTFNINTLDTDGPLPGTELDRFYRIPMLLMLAAAPLLGLAFVMFLPLIGFVMVLHLLGTKAYHLIADAATEGVRVLRPSWAPALAFLSRHKPAKPAPTAENPATDAWSEDVAKKLNDDETRES
jgi:hypothetical protein